MLMNIGYLKYIEDKAYVYACMQVLPKRKHKHIEVI